MAKKQCVKSSTHDTLDLPGVVTKDFNNALDAEYADPNLYPVFI